MTVVKGHIAFLYQIPPRLLIRSIILPVDDS